MIGGADSAVVHLLSDTGRVRGENQDRCGEFARPKGERLIVVADGMGGHQGGATAARLAVDAMGQVFSGSNEEGAALLVNAVGTANGEVCQNAEDDTRLKGMGSTLVALLLGERDFVMHLGDSRAYRRREGKLELLTEDHSTVMELVRTGRITPEEADSHPRRNEVLRSLGAPGDVEPEIQEIEIRAGDQYLLCSDGLTSVVSAEAISELLMRHQGYDAVKALIEAANDAGSPDNVTVALIEIPTVAGWGDSAPKDVDRLPISRRPAVRRLRNLALVTIVLLVLASALFILSFLMRGEEASLQESGPESEQGAPAPRDSALR